MNVGLLVSALRKRRVLRSHEAWSPASLAAHRAQSLDELRRFTIQRSAFYRRFHRGLEHRPLEDRPVPPGVQGAKILVTVLFSRTQPLIRYEMSDTVTLAAEACPCGIPFAKIEAIDGRAEDTLVLSGVSGQPIRVHPNVFHHALEALPVRQWQVIQEPSRIRVLLAGATADVDELLIASDVRRELQRVGAVSPEVLVERVEHVERTAAGKAPLVRVQVKARY